MIITRTPLRLSFLGGGSDYREYYNRKKGAVLGTTINKYVYVSVNRLSQFFDYCYRVGYSKMELTNKVDDIIHPSVRECIKKRGIQGNLDIHIFADLPASTGLGSSSAFTVGFLHALHGLEGKVIPKFALAEEALFVEHYMTRENVGAQDQYHAAFGGFNLIEFSEARIDVRPIPLLEEKKQLLEKSILVFYTRKTRYTTDIVQEQIDNTANGSKDDYIRKMYNIVFDGVKLLSEQPASDLIAGMGHLLQENWALKKSLSNQVSNDFIDEAYQAAINAGAAGGKLAGAGGGGFLMFLVEEKKQAAVRAALKQLPEVHLGLDSQGSVIIYQQ